MRRQNLRQLTALLGAVLMMLPAAKAAEPETRQVETPAAAAADAVSPQAASAVEEDWRLRLVNPWNALPEDFTVELARLKNGMQVDKRIYDDLNEMLTDCQEAGLHPVVCSAYRTQSTQTRLYNNKVSRLRNQGYSWEGARTEAARWVALPGTSEHQTGLALDIVAASYQVLDDQQAGTAEQKWLMEHCWEYGFILRYAEDKCQITGIGYEPWHYRYVGREAAAAIQESGQCLEEHLASNPAPVEPAAVT